MGMFLGGGAPEMNYLFERKEGGGRERERVGGHKFVISLIYAFIG